MDPVEPPTDNDQEEAIEAFRQMTRRGREHSEAALATLLEAEPRLTELLRSGYCTGQGSRARQLLWSLYNGSGLVQLGYTCCGFDTQIAKDLTAAIGARLAMGADVEEHLKRILVNSGEMARFHEEADRTPENRVIVYPAAPAAAEFLRDLATRIEEQEELARKLDLAAQDA